MGTEKFLKNSFFITFFLKIYPKLKTHDSVPRNCLKPYWGFSIKTKKQKEILTFECLLKCFLKTTSDVEMQLKSTLTPLKLSERMMMFYQKRWIAVAGSCPSRSL